MRHFALLALAALCAFTAAAVVPEEVENVHVADRTRYVTDMAGVLSPQTLARADTLLARTWGASTAEPVVVIVPDLSGRDIDTFATELFTQWGIGKKDRDNGVLMLISVGDRKATIRTGYGAEGVLPDVYASRIIRGDLAPHFRRGDYDGGVLAGVNSLAGILTGDEAIEELRSQTANDAGPGQSDAQQMWEMYLAFCIIVGCVMLLIVLYLFATKRGEPTGERYERLRRWRVPALMASAASLGMALPAWLALMAAMRHVRLHKRLCPNCSARMGRLDEEADNAFLTHAQDTEEHLGSVDYDVWLCPGCGETDVIPYVNPKSSLRECPHCQARARALTADRTLVAPTERRHGVGQREYVCRNCGAHDAEQYKIPQLPPPPPPIVPLGGGRGGFGGGISGGSFGGGMTGGGGASGGW